MQDAAAFYRPIAHRGLHNADKGIVENTAEAFAAAIARGYGIECDVQPAADGTPMVFHDPTLERLMEAEGPLAACDAATLKRLAYRGAATHMIELGDLLALVGGRVPLLVEIKSEWNAPDQAFLQAVADRATAYRGPLGLMSFDPAVVATIKGLAPSVPRGIVSGLFEGEGWWRQRLGPERAYRLSHLLKSRKAAPDFYAYHVGSLPTPVTRFVREVLGMALFTWTVRTQADREIAAQWADAPIFEGYEP